MFRQLFRRPENSDAPDVTQSLPEPTMTDSTLSTLRIPMVRFDISGRLEKDNVLVTTTQYLAISHVWGDAQWQEIPGIDGEVLVSKEKANFITERLRSIVGTDYFWMDILCVEQRDKAARIAVTAHIPVIFRHAQKTILVRGSRGFRECCIKSITIPEQPSTKWFNGTFATLLKNHYREVHDGEDFTDGVLLRLWPLQEIILSDTIQVVRCDDAESRRFPLFTPPWHIRDLVYSLSMMAAAWSGHSNAYAINFETKSLMKLVRAFFSCDTASRESTENSLPHFPWDVHFGFCLSSARRTTESRDFILAVMPQYSFYSLPDNAKDMTFQQLFVDCYQQLEQCHSFPWMAPLISAPFQQWPPPTPTPNIPEPVFLSDFIKLFFGPRIAYPPTVHQVQVEKVSHLSNSDVFQHVLQAVERSRIVWMESTSGELAEMSREAEMLKHLTDPAITEDETRAQIAKSAPQYGAILGLWNIVECLKHGRHPELLSRLEDMTFELADADVVLRLAALISCGLGVSAYEWSKPNLVPVFVTFEGRKFIGLAPDSALNRDDDYVFYLVEAQRYWVVDGVKRFALVGGDAKTNQPILTLCLFPPDINIYGWKIWKNWKWGRD
jgi:hypothetical protein